MLLMQFTILFSLQTTEKISYHVKRSADHIHIHSTTILSGESVQCDLQGNYCVPVCDAEKFDHYYIGLFEQLQKMNNMWMTTPGGKIGELQKICLQRNGLPVTRKCRYDQSKNSAEWESIADWKPVHCLNLTSEKIMTHDLHLLKREIEKGEHSLDSPQGRSEVITQLKKIVKKEITIRLPADVAYTSEIMHAVTRNSADVEIIGDVVNVYNNMLQIDRKVLATSAVLNATDSLLDTIETYTDSLANKFLNNICEMPTERCNPNLTNCTQLAELGVHTEISADFSIFYINPNCKNISGIVIYNNTVMHSEHKLYEHPLGKYQYRFLHFNDTLEQLNKTDELSVAAKVSETDWINVKNTIINASSLVIKLYTDDRIFIENSINITMKPYNNIIAISIPGYFGDFKENITFAFRLPTFKEPKLIDSHEGCRYWNSPTWSSDGVITGTKHDHFMLCNATHLTHFGYLIGLRQFSNYQQRTGINDIRIHPPMAPIDIVSIIGCSISLFGLIGIWLTVLIFPAWKRNSVVRKIILHLCFVITIQMILFLFINTDKMAKVLTMENELKWVCVLVGASTQYIVLVMFMWTLSLAYLQFHRFVTVLGDQRPPHFVLKSAIFAWSVPLIPTLLCAFIDWRSYIPTQDQMLTRTGICYPSGQSLIFGVFTPVAIVVCANFAIFYQVFYSIRKTTREMTDLIGRIRRTQLKQRLLLSILLFFMLGLPWIFGVLSFMEGGIVLSWLFCLTATTQGFVFFVFYVLLDEYSREAWVKLLFSKCKQKSKPNVPTLEPQSTSQQTELQQFHESNT